MRPVLVQALRAYYADSDDAVGDALLLGPADGPQTLNQDRLVRLLLRALREQQQDLAALTARVAVLEAPPPPAP